MSKKVLSWRTKICLYKSLILTLLYGAETWTLTSSDDQALGVFERKILRKIYEPFCDRVEWRIRWNQELCDIYHDIDIVKRIKIQRLRWRLSYVAGMDSPKPVRKVFESEPGGGCRRQGRPPQRWAKQVDKNLRTLGIRNWRQAATARDVWCRNRL